MGIRVNNDRKVLRWGFNLIGFILVLALIGSFFKYKYYKYQYDNAGMFKIVRGEVLSVSISRGGGGGLVRLPNNKKRVIFESVEPTNEKESGLQDLYYWNPYAQSREFFGGDKPFCYLIPIKKHRDHIPITLERYLLKKVDMNIKAIISGFIFIVITGLFRLYIFRF